MAHDKNSALSVLLAELCQHGVLSRAAQVAGVSTETIGRWRVENAEINDAITRAVAAGLEVHVDALLTAHNDMDTQRAKVYSDNIKWLAARRLRAVYGDHLDVTMQGRVDIGTTLLEARSRSRPVCDQRDIIDAQVVETKEIKDLRSTDTQSVEEADAGTKSLDDTVDSLLKSIT